MYLISYVNLNDSEPGQPILCLSSNQSEEYLEDVLNNQRDDDTLQRILAALHSRFDRETFQQVLESDDYGFVVDRIDHVHI